MNRFTIYLASLQSKGGTEYAGPLPTGLVPSPSINTLATSGISDELMSTDIRMRGGSPLPQQHGRERSPAPSSTLGRRDSPMAAKRKWLDHKK